MTQTGRVQRVQRGATSQKIRCHGRRKTAGHCDSRGPRKTRQLAKKASRLTVSKQAIVCWVVGAVLVLILFLTR
jgi:hypothetical protein